MQLLGSVCQAFLSGCTFHVLTGSEWDSCLNFRCRLRTAVLFQILKLPRRNFRAEGLELLDDFENLSPVGVIKKLENKETMGKIFLCLEYFFLPNDFREQLKEFRGFGLEREVFSKVPAQRCSRASSGLAVGQQVGGAMSPLKTQGRAMSIECSHLAGPVMPSSVTVT